MLGFAALGEMALGELVTVVSSDLIAAGATVTISGQVAGLYATRYLTADAGGFTFAGFESNLAVARSITAEAGAFVMTFQPAQLSKGVRFVRGGGGTRGIAVRPSGGARGLRIRA